MCRLHVCASSNSYLVLTEYWHLSSFVDVGCVSLEDSLHLLFASLALTEYCFLFVTPSSLACTPHTFEWHIHFCASEK